MLFLWCFVSAVLRGNFSSFRSTLHNLSHIVLCNVWNWSLLRSEGKVQNWVRRRSYYLNLCEAHGLNTWGQLPHLMKNGRKISVMRRTSCSSLSRVLSTRSSCSTSLTSPTSLSQDCEKIYLCPEQHYEVRIWVNKHKETCYKPSHRTTNKHGETRYRLNCHEERCNRKRIHTHFLKDWDCDMQGRPELLGLYARDAQVMPYLEQQNLGELIAAEHKVLIDSCESGNNDRYAIVVQNLAAERSVTKQNFSRPTWINFLEFGINLWSWPWNYWKV